MLDMATLWELGKFSIDSYRWAKKNICRKVDYLIPQVEHFINTQETKVRIHRILNKTPRVYIQGTGKLSVQASELAAVKRPKLILNELHAIAERWNGDEAPEVRANAVDFADVLALRELAGQASEMPHVLSSGAVLICPSKRFILLHRRSSNSATYPNSLHILGGAFKPSEDRGVIDVPGDRQSLEFTMIREVFEESGLIVRGYQEPICVATEVDTGFIQFVYLGVRITETQAAELSANAEGDLVTLSFDNLVTRLSDATSWVPTGRAQVLMWLGLGAPGAGWSPRFGNMSATEAFAAVVSN